AIQGHMPERMHVVTGTGERETFKTNDYLAYYRRAKQRFLTALDHEHETYPWPVEHCALCDFLKLCIERRERDDHLVLVANIRRNQIDRLQRDGVATLAALAETETRPRGMREPTFKAIRGGDRDAEKHAFEELVCFLTERRRIHPGMHVYHYNHYERTALRRLMGEHGTCEDEIDDLLRGEVLVDLFQVVRQAMRISK